MGCGSSSASKQPPPSASAPESEEHYKTLFQATVEAGRENGDSEEKIAATLLSEVFGPGEAGRELPPAEAKFYQGMLELSPPSDFLKEHQHGSRDGGEGEAAAAGEAGAGEEESPLIPTEGREEAHVGAVVGEEGEGEESLEGGARDDDDAAVEEGNNNLNNATVDEGGDGTPPPTDDDTRRGVEEAPEAEEDPAVEAATPTAAHEEEGTSATSP
jgi:hypothetical protein